CLLKKEEGFSQRSDFTSSLILQPPYLVGIYQAVELVLGDRDRLSEGSFRALLKCFIEEGSDCAADDLLKRIRSQRRECVNFSLLDAISIPPAGSAQFRFLQWGGRQAEVANLLDSQARREHLKRKARVKPFAHGPELV